MSNIESTKAAYPDDAPQKPGATTRLMELLEVIDNLENQADSIIAVALGDDSNPREAGPSAILDFQIDHAIAQARTVSDKLHKIYRAL